MSIDSKYSTPRHGWLRVGACALAVFLAVGFGSFGSALALDATPVATAPTCTAPALPPGTPTPQEEATPGAEMDMSTPEAAPADEATPVPVVGTAAEGATAVAITASVNNIIACANVGDGMVAALFTTNFVEFIAGTDNPYDAVAALQGFTFTQWSVSNPMTNDDGSVSADVQYMSAMSEYQLNSERWFLVQDGDFWKIDSQTLISPTTDLDSAAIGVSLTEATDDAGAKTYAIEPNAADHAEVPALILHAINAGTEAHELAMIQLPDGSTFDDVISGKIGEDDVKFIGAVAPILPGGEADLTLINLPVGKYTLVCFFDAADGQPHAFHGMHTDFEVTAAT